MTIAQRAVGVAVAAGLVAVAAVFVLPALDDGERPGPDRTVLAWTDDGDSAAETSPLALAPPEERTVVQRGVYDGLPVLVFVSPAAILEGVEEVHGEGAATPSVAYPGHPSHRVFAVSAKSTHLGCTVTFMPDLGASMDIADYDGDGSKDGRILDPCHQGQWDPYAGGARVPRTFAPRDLPVLEIRLEHVDEDIHVLGYAYDGIVGPPR